MRNSAGENHPMSIFGSIRSAIFPTGAKVAPPAETPQRSPKDTVAKRAPGKTPSYGALDPADSDEDRWAPKSGAAKSGKVPDDLQ
jgi:hypothetical protein